MFLPTSKMPEAEVILAPWLVSFCVKGVFFRLHVSTCPNRIKRHSSPMFFNPFLCVLGLYPVGGANICNWDHACRHWAAHFAWERLDSHVCVASCTYLRYLVSDEAKQLQNRTEPPSCFTVGTGVPFLVCFIFLLVNNGAGGTGAKKLQLCLIYPEDIIQEISILANCGLAYLRFAFDNFFLGHLPLKGTYISCKIHLHFIVYLVSLQKSWI